MKELECFPSVNTVFCCADNFRKLFFLHLRNFSNE